MHPRLLHVALPVLATILIAARASGGDGDEHWSRQFRKPAGSDKMTPATGMSDGTNKPIFRNAKWHDGKLWISGAWEGGVDPLDITKKQLNCYWYIWTWSPTAGWEAFAWFHTSQGGNGPDGKVNDFLWLPDGRMVVAGEFTRLDNPGGMRYERVDALAVYDPKEPTANKWRPLGTFQYDGTVSPGGSIQSIVYDPKGNDLYVGGSFGGIPGPEQQRKAGVSPAVHRYDFDTGSYEPMEPGLHGAGAVIVHRLAINPSTDPATVYVAGRFHYTGGNGEDPMQSSSTSRYTTSFASWQLGKGWTWFPRRGIRPQEGGKEAILQRAADFMYFDSVNIHDVLLDGEDIWIAGSFAEGQESGQTIRGIAKWDAAKQIWVDPTRKGGFGRDVFSIAKADDGGIYVAGAFGGPSAPGKSYKGFQDGSPAALCARLDPATGEWTQLGSGLAGRMMPECRLVVHGNDVYYFGDFTWIGAGRDGKGKDDKAYESWYVARWNSRRDFLAEPERIEETAGAGSGHLAAPTVAWAKGNEHWSRAFPAPPRATGKTSNMSGRTGMDRGKGVPNPSGIVKIGDTLWFCGRWEADLNVIWHVWTHHREHGWKGVAWTGPGGKGEGPQSPPSGMKVRNGRLWVYGSIANYAGICFYDLDKNSWHALEGRSQQGDPLFGNGDPNKGMPVKDIAWDERTGDLYIVGSSGGLSNPKYSSPKAVGQVIRVDTEGVYHPMGRMLMPETPKAPSIQECIWIDGTKDPADIYVGGTFGFWGADTSHANFAYNIVMWNHAEQDWRPVPVDRGDRVYLSPLDAGKFPNGLPGLPAHPTDVFHGFQQEGFPRIRCLTMDGEGNLYAGGSLGIVTGTLPMSERLKEETYGIAKYDAKTRAWGPCTRVGGVSRDVYQMSWLDAGRTKLLLTGSFFFDNAWNPLNGVAVLDTRTGTLEPLGGGFLTEGRSQVSSPDVRHFVDGDDIWFTGVFDHVGANANDLVGAPIESASVAHWNATRNLDPNRGLVVAPVDPVAAPAGHSAGAVKVTLAASLEDGDGTILWFERSRSGEWKEVGKGGKVTLDLRLKAADGDQMFYVSILRADGTMGGKVPVRVPVVAAGK